MGLWQGCEAGLGRDSAHQLLCYCWYRLPAMADYSLRFIVVIVIHAPPYAWLTENTLLTNLATTIKQVNYH